MATVEVGEEEVRLATLAMSRLWQHRPAPAASLSIRTPDPPKMIIHMKT